MPDMGVGGGMGIGGSTPVDMAPEGPAVSPPPAPGAGCGGAFLCDDFEALPAGTSPGAPNWSLIDAYNPTTGQTASVQVTTERAHGGLQSVFVSGANGRTGIIGSVPARNYYVRAWMFAEQAPTGPVLAGFGSDGNNEVRFRIWNNSWATINSTVGDDLVPAAARAGNCPDCPTVPAGQWFCMEFHVDDAAQSATLWIDGAEAAVLNGSWPTMPDTASVFLGDMRIQDGTDVYVDDVVAGPDRIGCN
jgi:hypothetical protein